MSLGEILLTRIGRSNTPIYCLAQIYIDRILLSAQCAPIVPVNKAWDFFNEIEPIDTADPSGIRFPHAIMRLECVQCVIIAGRVHYSSQSDGTAVSELLRLTTRSNSHISAMSMSLPSYVTLLVILEGARASTDLCVDINSGVMVFTCFIYLPMVSPNS